MPAMTAVIGLMTMLKPIKLPIKFTIRSKIPPSIPLAINLIINLIGTTNSIPIMYSKKRPKRKAKTMPMSILTPPLIATYYIIMDMLNKYYLFPNSFAFFKK